MPARNPDTITVQRNTQQRDAIRRVIEDSNRPLTAREILTAARHHIPDLGLATIYRTLTALCEEGQLITRALPGKAARYDQPDSDTHPHFLCHTCKRALKLPESPVNMADFAPKGYRVERCELTLFGQCPDCSKPKRRPTRQSSARKKNPSGNRMPRLPENRHQHGGTKGQRHPASPRRRGATP